MCVCVRACLLFLRDLSQLKTEHEQQFQIKRINCPPKQSGRKTSSKHRVDSVLLLLLLFLLLLGGGGGALLTE